MGAIVDLAPPYPLHQLGWKSFQDLAVAVAEECLRRPVQTFLPVKDAGRDGAFVGSWEGEDPAAGNSTIQCKFTSKADENLSLSMLKEELEKVRLLAERGLATDYIVLTNHRVTGASDLKIRAAFEEVGAGRCRVFGYDWLVRQIRASPRLRMMAPRLYGLGDLSELLDARAYAQAQLILSSMGEDIRRLVVTDAHRRSVRAISEHNLVLLLGPPAAGKSTIGASIAIGAADIWSSSTIRATSPEDIREHLDPQQKQFFWIDDAWGNTQYQVQTAERWNQVFPLMQGAMQRGTRFLITSRDYIWKAAQSDLKLQAIPVLRKSQVVIDVQKLSTQERAQILYNHLKLGDQPTSFRHKVKEHLPALAELPGFLPETARRLGSQFFAGRSDTSREGLVEFFREPQAFLLDTITNLSDQCRAAIATIFLNGGKVRSPVVSADIESAAMAFGVAEADIRKELEALDGSLLMLAQDEEGQYWTYKHPTVSDAFSRFVAASPEQIEIYLRGAKPESLLREVVCAGVDISGTPVVVPDSLHSLLLRRVGRIDAYILRSFISYRANRKFCQLVLAERPELLRSETFITPIAEDQDTRLIARLHGFGLLPEEHRLRFVGAVRDLLAGEADASAFDNGSIEAIFTLDEKIELLEMARTQVLGRIAHHVGRLQDSWSPDYAPDDHFVYLAESMECLIERVLPEESRLGVQMQLDREIRWAIEALNDDYQPPSSTSAPTSLSSPANAGLVSLFRDVDE